MNNYTWLDALSDGKMFRSWLALFASFWFAVVYFVFIVTGFAIALSLSVVLIGIPLLLFMLSATRTLAMLDRKVMAAILDVDPPPDIQDVDLRGANLGTRLGLYLGSGATWRSALYLLAKLPISLLAISISLVILLPLALEVLILAPLTVDLHLITVRLLRWSSIGLYRLNNWLLPSGKVKRRDQREQIDEAFEDDPRYYNSEGEVAVAKRGH